MKYIVDIKGEIEGDYEIIGKYDEVLKRTDIEKQGEWIEDNGDLRCPFCKVLRDSIHGGFCPNCGADMRGAK